MKKWSFVLLAASLCTGLAWAQKHSDKEIQEDAKRHRAMAAAWADLRPGLDGLAGGRWPAEAEAAAFDRWAAFDALYRGHLAAEDGTAYPQAARRIAAAELPAIGAEMAARRGASPATAAPAAR